MELPGLVELGELEPGDVELGDVELGELELGDAEFDGEALLLSGLVELTLLRSLFVLAPGVLGVLLLFGEVTPGVLGVVLSGCAPGVVAPG